MNAQALPDPIIQLDGVGMTYADGTVGLHETTTRFREGDLTVLLGLSGAGKSTLLRSVNHLVKPTSGLIWSRALGPIATRNNIRAHRRRTAMIFQHHQLLPRFTALQNVLTGRLAYHSTVRGFFPLPRAELRIAHESLERVGLADKALTRVDNLSGGQMQRVGIARALAQQPETILADEPVASLDPATSDKVLGLLRGICTEDGITAVISLHQLELATKFADRILGLAGGRVVFDGAPGELTDAVIHAIYGTGDREHDRPLHAATA
ncbi:phosphonate ABC transporter ATP-binding protein [Aquisalimonas lutea]|uniref:phosphonate ABC transporter ATP-binding protein n=1 Tax=Aquisalimonas lutea TaxID=1327750 RepID=UPI00338F9FE2